MHGEGAEPNKSFIKHKGNLVKQHVLFCRADRMSDRSQLILLDVENVIYANIASKGISYL